MVTTLDEARHGLETGDYVTFTEVRGMEPLNGCEPIRITETGMPPPPVSAPDLAFCLRSSPITALGRVSRPARAVPVLTGACAHPVPPPPFTRPVRAPRPRRAP